MPKAINLSVNHTFLFITDDWCDSLMPGAFAGT